MQVERMVLMVLRALVVVREHLAVVELMAQMERMVLLEIREVAEQVAVVVRRALTELRVVVVREGHRVEAEHRELQVLAVPRAQMEQMVVRELVDKVRYLERREQAGQTGLRAVVELVEQVGLMVERAQVVRRAHRGRVEHHLA